MTKDEQLAVIRETQFFNDLRTKMQAIRAAMVADTFMVQGQVVTIVDGVTVTATFLSDIDVQLSVGQDERGNSLYEWKAPSAWAAPVTPPVDPPPAP